MANPYLTAEEVGALDLEYQPFSPFTQWLECQVDGERWNRYKAILDARRAEGAPFAEAVTFAIRAAAYDTGAIEGLYRADRGTTATVAAEAAGWEETVDQQGPNVRATFEAQLEGYKYAQKLADSPRPVNEADIRQLHAELCRAQDTYTVETPLGKQEHQLPKGEYKTSPNHVALDDGSRHAYAPVTMTRDEMQRLVEEMRRPAFSEAHPALQAAYAHHGIVAVHPFADGNGRVARALAAMFLFRNVLIPFLMYTDEHDPYVDALRLADGGHPQLFLNFVFDRGIDAMALVTYRMHPAQESIAARFAELYQSPMGRTYAELDALAEKVISAVQAEATELLNNKSVVPFGGGMAIAVSNLQVSPNYRWPLTGPRGFQVSMSTPTPAYATVAMNFRLLVSKIATDRYPFVVEMTDLPNERLEARIEDVDPQLTLSFKEKAKGWVATIFGATVERLYNEARTYREKQGI